MSTESTVRIENIPQTWNDETDTAFFNIVARLFSAEFTYGASVLLATFDSSDSVDVGTACEATADGTFAESGVAAGHGRSRSRVRTPVS